MGIFITVEGPNRVGKFIFIKRLEEVILSKHIVFLTREALNSNFGNYVKKK